MANSVKCLGKIKINDINTVTVMKRECPDINAVEQLRTSRTFRSVWLDKSVFSVRVWCKSGCSDSWATNMLHSECSEDNKIMARCKILICMQRGELYSTRVNHNLTTLSFVNK